MCFKLEMRHWMRHDEWIHPYLKLDDVDVKCIYLQVICILISPKCQDYIHVTFWVCFALYSYILQVISSTRFKEYLLSYYSLLEVAILKSIPAAEMQAQTFNWTLQLQKAECVHKT